MKQIHLTKTQQKLLTSLTTRSSSPQKLVLRAGIILAHHESSNKRAVAATCSVGRETVYRWFNRWVEAKDELAKLEAEHQAEDLSDALYQRALSVLLDDAPRPGHHPTFTEEEKQKIIALASEKPETVGVPVTHWTHKLLRNAVIDKGIVTTISSAQVGRFLKQSHAEASQG